MAQGFNIDEVLQMAEQIESNGAIFYAQAAADASDDAVKAFLDNLSKTEEKHCETFAQMRTALSDSEKEPMVFDPDDETALYLKALADTRVFFEKSIDTGSIDTVLKEALLAEKDSIVFYLGLKQGMPAGSGQDKIEQIIQEEMTHIRVLSTYLLKYGNK